MKIFAKIFSVFTWFVTFAAILLAAVFVLPRVFGIEPYIVMSGSMEPVITTGAVAFIDTHETDAIVGDIITFTLENGETVTHRISDIEDGMYVTKGDTNDTEDPVHVDPDNVIGTYSFQIPKVGYLMTDFTPKVIFICILWIAFLNVASILISSVADRPSEEKAVTPVVRLNISNQNKKGERDSITADDPSEK